MQSEKVKRRSIQGLGFVLLIALYMTHPLLFSVVFVVLVVIHEWNRTKKTPR